MSRYLLAGSQECVAEIARSTKSQVAIQALLELESPAVTLELARNVNLTPATRALLRKGAKVEMLTALASSAVGDAQIEEVLSSSSKKVVESLYQHGVKGASPKLTSRLIEKATGVQAYIWVDSGIWPEAKQLVKLLDKSIHSWTFLSDPRLVKAISPSQAVRIVEKFLNDSEATNYYNRLDDCLDARPELIPAFAKIAKGRQEYASISPIFEALFNTRHIFDQKLYSSLIKASARLSKLDRRRVLADLFEHPNVDADTTYEIYLVFSSDPTVKRAARDYLAESFQQHYDKKLGKLAVVTQDWATIKSGPQKRTIKRYRDTWHGEYPTLDYPKEYRQATAVGSPSVRTRRQDLSKTFLGGPDAWSERLLTSSTFERQVLPKIEPLGLPGFRIFFGLASDWRASAAELMHATRASAS